MHWLSLRQRPQCPVDGQHLHPSHLSRRECDQRIINQLNELELKCGFESKGCQRIVSLNELEMHEKQCEHNPQNIFIKDLDRNGFVSEVNQEFICSLCLNVFKNAVITEKCRHLFCSECIQKSLSQRSECPVDRNPLYANDLKERTE